MSTSRSRHSVKYHRQVRRDEYRDIPGAGLASEWVWPRAPTEPCDVRTERNTVVWKKIGAGGPRAKI